MKNVILYTDGACSGNPGPGGYGAILTYSDHEREISGGRRGTTNNRMEILAVIKGLELLKEPCDVKVVTDSQYVANAVSKGWARKWRANGWKRNKKEKALNPDLWGRLLDLCDTHRVTFQWVRGHNGHPMNERCDQLAVDAARDQGNPVDDRP